MNGDGEPPGRCVVAFELGEPAPLLATVRRWAGEFLAELAEDDLGDVLLVMTELVSNAYDHGRPARRIRLLRVQEPPEVRIEVEDTSLELPVLGRSRINDDRGRGLIIVDNLATSWGVVRHAGGKTVWASVTCGSTR